MGAFRLIYRLPWMLLHVLLGLPPTLLSFLTFFKATRAPLAGLSGLGKARTLCTGENLAPRTR